MKIQNLKGAFQKFLTDNNRAIIVDGAWGIGKTYHVLQFIKELKKSKSKQKIIYVSLFGKSNIDEVHTEIYSRLHPIKKNAKKIIEVIPKVAPLVGTVGDIISNLEFALKDSDTEESQKDTEKDVLQESSKDTPLSEHMSAVENIADNLNTLSGDSESLLTKTSNKYRNIIVLDDFERLDFEKISLIDMLGYVNSLFLQNFKVIVVCNSKEIRATEENNFLAFKEKVFDREYIITATNEEIINSYFGEDFVSLDDYIISEFNNNLRIAKRVSNFYMETTGAIKEFAPNYLEKWTKESILFSCTLIIVACNTSKYNQDNTEKLNLTDMMMLASLELDNSLQKIIIDINKHVRDSGLGKINNQLIAGLLLFYYYDDISKLKMFFVENEEKPQNPLLEEAFLMSDSSKEELFNRQFNFIVEQSTLKEGNVFQAIKSMCRYHMYSHIDEREKEIISNLLQKCDEKDIHRMVDISFADDKDNSRLIQFRETFMEIRIEMFVSKMCSDLKKLYKDKKYSAILDKLNSISRNNIYSTTEERRRILVNDILSTIEECNFFIDDLFGDISYSQWDVAHQICELSNEYSFSDKLIDFIKSINFKGDKSAEERYNFLLQNKFH